MATFQDYILTLRATNPGSVPSDQVTQFETFIKYWTAEYAKAGKPAPNAQELIRLWAQSHATENKSITTLTIVQLEGLIRHVVREELEKAG